MNSTAPDTRGLSTTSIFPVLAALLAQEANTASRAEVVMTTLSTPPRRAVDPSKAGVPSQREQSLQGDQNFPESFSPFDFLCDFCQTLGPLCCDRNVHLIRVSIFD